MFPVIGVDFVRVSYCTCLSACYCFT